MSEDKQDPAVWIDSQGRTWSLAVTVNTIRRVRELAAVNLLDVFDGQLLGRLAEDPELLVNTLYAVCKPQADERDVSDEAFGELLVGDAIEEAASALVRGLIDFFPKERRAILERLWKATVKTQTEAARLMTSKLDAGAVDATIKTILNKASDQIDRELERYCEGFGNSPESSASIPVP